MMRNSKMSIGPAGHSSGAGNAPARGWQYSTDPVEIMQPDRRRLWTAATFVACCLAAGLISVGYFATQPFDHSVPPTTTLGELRLAPTLAEAPPLTGAVQPDDLGPPMLTGSLPPSAAQGTMRDLPMPFGQAQIANRQAILSTLLALPLPVARRARADRPTVLAELTGLADPTVLAVKEPVRLASLTDSAALRSLINPVAAPRPNRQTIIVVDGDTLSEILARLDIDQTDILALVRGLKPVFAPGQLRAGQELALVLGRDSAGAVVPLSLSFEYDGREISVTRTKQRRYVARRQGGGALAGSLAQTRTLARIYGSLYRTARQQKVPDAVIVRMMRTHSYDVDFQRQIKAGDPFEVYYTGGGAAVTGKKRATLLFSSLTTAGKKRSYYRFSSPDGVTDFYSAKGESSKKPLMRTPLNGARISSGFGRRKHPILGYTKMHSGTDFAAPRGTPVYAAGDGVVAMAGRNGGYGNYVRLTHKKGLATAYAHLHRIAKGIRPGARVRQGQIIAFVGSTGRSTGPHLHYEVMVKGRKKNPLTVKVAGTGRRLLGKILAKFRAEKTRIDRLRQAAPVSTLVAAARP
ncbi:MAG: peptidoglycan DD-metalloendopeptidase family protein [Alphaproteobacteria bacterium]